MGSVHNVQQSSVAHLCLVPGGFQYWWYDGKGTRWSSGVIKTREAAVRRIKDAGFGRYRFGEKTITIS